MAQVRVSLKMFKQGEFPGVCAKTGERADRLLPVTATYTPRWTWLLLPFGGFLAFLIGRGFAAEEIVGLVPFSGPALARSRARGRHRLLAIAVVGVLLLPVLLDRAAWPPAIMLVAAPIAILGGWLSVGVVGGDAIGARFDPERETVLLWGVHEAFKRAVETGQRSDPALRQAD